MLIAKLIQWCMGESGSFGEFGEKRWNQHSEEE
jgi:hypothetical protein